jgi:uroporphyrin-III C-methyltransferase
MSQDTTSTNTTTGHVSFVGAGPGSVDLLTIRSLRCLQQADIVLYDALVQPEVLNLAESAIKLSVGKRSGQPSMSQELICELIVSSAHQYKNVVRLKGGDVSVFGRLDEEITILAVNNIAFTIIPGITAASAAAASLAKPLTKRNVSRSVTLLTGDTLTRDMPSIPVTDSLVVYMGRRQAKKIAATLIKQGKKTTTPVVLISNVSLKSEQHVQSTLVDIAFNPQPIIDQFEENAPLLWLIGDAFSEVATSEIQHNNETDSSDYLQLEQRAALTQA